MERGEVVFVSGSVGRGVPRESNVPGDVGLKDSDMLGWCLVSRRGGRVQAMEGKVRRALAIHPSIHSFIHTGDSNYRSCNLGAYAFDRMPCVGLLHREGRMLARCLCIV